MKTGDRIQRKAARGVTTQNAFRTPSCAFPTGNNPHSARGTLRARFAFTLIELLVVIAVISVLAAMLFPITGAVNRIKIRTKARAELAQVRTDIESYKSK